MYMAHYLVLRYENACQLILWFDEQHHDEPWYTGKCARAVENRYVTISLQVVLQGCQRALLGMWLPQGFTTSVIFTFTHYLVSMSYCQKFRLFVIYMSKLVSPRSGQKVCTIQDW